LIDKGQDLGDGTIQVLGDFLPKIELGEGLHQIGVFVNGDTVLLGDFADAFGEVAGAFGGKPGSAVRVGVVADGYGALALSFVAGHVCVIH